MNPLFMSKASSRYSQNFKEDDDVTRHLEIDEDAVQMTLKEDGE